MPLKAISRKLQLKVTPQEPMVWALRTALFMATQSQSSNSHSSTPSLCSVFCLLILCVCMSIIIHPDTHTHQFITRIRQKQYCQPCLYKKHKAQPQKSWDWLKMMGSSKQSLWESRHFSSAQELPACSFSSSSPERAVWNKFPFKMHIGHLHNHHQTPGAGGLKKINPNKGFSGDTTAHSTVLTFGQRLVQ